MKNYLKVIILFLFCLSHAKLNAQDKSPVKFGKISQEDFRDNRLASDTGAHAVIIADIGISRILPNKEGGFSYEFQRNLRVKILDIAGIDAGKFVIPIYTARNTNGKEEIKSIKGISYNVEGGKITETKLNSDQVFTEVSSKYLKEKKFSMPALKAGTIFEISYTILSDFLFDFRPWEFQHEYPCLWSEFQIEVPQFYEYVYLWQGYQSFHISTKSDDLKTFLIRNDHPEPGSNGTFTITGMVHKNRWVIKDVPALKEENFTTTIENHRSKIEFQLSSINYPGQEPRPVMDTWTKVSKDFMAHESFGLQLEKYSPWVKDYLKENVGSVSDPEAMSQRIYAHVRDNFTCIRSAGLYVSSDLKTVLKTKSGNVADINLLLIAMLRQSNIECYPVILSTRSHGYVNETYPMLDRYNYVIGKVFIGKESILLDATIPNLAFGRLHLNCYNGTARILTTEPSKIFLPADSILERSTTVAILKPEKNVYKCRVTSNPGYYESFEHRNFIIQKGETAFFEKIKDYYGNDFEVSAASIDSLKKLEEPVKVSYDLSFKHNEEDILYFNPIIVPFYKENPFSAVVRNYPVEMPYKIDETFILNMELPVGYTAEEIPKSVKVKMNEDEGYFEYLVSFSEGLIQVKTRLVISKTNFPPDDYDRLREFFSYVVKKQEEQIVLKKK